MARRSALFELTRSRVLLFLREPEVVFWVFAFPVLLAAVLGFAFRKGAVKPSRVAVLQAEPALAETLGAAEHLETESVASAEEAEVALRKGGVDAFVAGDPPTIRMDPERPEAELTRLRVQRALDLERAPEGLAELQLDAVREKGSRYVDFLFPGLLGLNLMGTGMWVIGFSVAELRQRRILKRMLVTPMRRTSFLLSFLMARLVFLALEIAALAGFGTWVLGVPFRAAVVEFGVLCLVGALSFCGLGLLVTSRVKTIQGASGLLNLALVPMWLFCGVFFSYERFPEALHPVLELIPLTALNSALRALMLEGGGLADVVPELLVQLAWGAGAFLLALRLFRWE